MSPKDAWKQRTTRPQPPLGSEIQTSSEAYMLAEMANVAAECIKNPGRESVWAPRLRKYVCRDTPEGQEAVAEQEPAAARSQAMVHPGISPKFKLVFLTATGGTAFFVVLCLILSMAAGKEPHGVL